MWRHSKKHRRGDWGFWFQHFPAVVPMTNSNYQQPVTSHTAARVSPASSLQVWERGLFAMGCCLLSRHLMRPARSQTVRRRLGSVTLTGQGLGLGTSLFPVGNMEIKAEIT